MKPPLPQSVYVAFEAFPRPKGASSHIAAMVTALARNHAPVWLLCLGYADMPAMQKEGDIHILRYKIHHPNLLKRADGFGRFVYERLTGLPQPPRLLVYRDPWGGWPAASALPESGRIFEVNALPSWELPYTYPAITGNAALRTKIEDTENFCLKTSHRVITVSHLTRQALARKGLNPERCRVVPNSADDLFFDSPPPSGLNVLEQGRWFGYFGSLHAWQGVEVLVEAWARIAGRFPDVKFLIVHTGRRAPLKRLRKIIRKRNLADRLFLQPPMTPWELASVLGSLEFTTAPLLETFRNTHQGCCPVKIVESMAVGVPVLASDLAVSRALISHEHDGWLTRPGSVRDWALALDRLLSDGPLRKRLAQNARQTAESRFHRQAMFDALDLVFSEAVHEGASGRQFF
jgi:glycosyltransferase involved in cell wall biosynthesis